MGLFDLEKKELFENCGMLSQGEARKEYCFDNPEVCIPYIIEFAIFLYEI